MKIVLALCLVCAVAVYAKPATNKYTTRFDNINIDQVLQSDRLLKNYIDCILDKGRCSPEGSELKRHLPDALEEDCSKCSEKQRTGTLKVIRFLIQKKPQIWKDVTAKFDPEGKYRKKYEDQAKQEGLIV